MYIYIYSQTCLFKMPHQPVIPIYLPIAEGRLRIAAVGGILVVEP